MTQFVAGIIPALLLLLALFSFMALAEELEDIGKGSFTLADALMVVFLTTPKRIVELLPVTTLLGGLIGLGAMANHRELIAIRTIGISKQRIAQTVAVLAVFLGIFKPHCNFSWYPGLNVKLPYYAHRHRRIRKSEPANHGQSGPGMTITLFASVM